MIHNTIAKRIASPIDLAKCEWVIHAYDTVEHGEAFGTFKRVGNNFECVGEKVDYNMPMFDHKEILKAFEDLDWTFEEELGGGEFGNLVKDAGVYIEDMDEEFGVFLFYSFENDNEANDYIEMLDL